MTNFSKLLTACLIVLFFIYTKQISAMEYDKKLHFGAGTSIGAMSQLVLDDSFQSLLVCSSVGALKEVYDQLDYGGADHKDFLFSMAGCLLGVYSTKAVGINIIPTLEGGIINFKVSF